MISKEEYLEWKTSVVTKELFRAIDLDVEEIKDRLVSAAGLNSVNDSRLRGMIEGLKAIREWKPDYPDEET